MIDIVYIVNKGINILKGGEGKTFFYALTCVKLAFLTNALVRPCPLHVNAPYVNEQSVFFSKTTFKNMTSKCVHLRMNLSSLKFGK